jgi:hypothetical protein
MAGSVITGSRHSIDSGASAVVFWVSFVLLFWLAHALGYFLHEFGHSFTAWISGYKATPLALTYGHLTPANLLIQSDVEENVEYGPIFAARKGTLAALIAGAGVVANIALYLGSRKLYSISKRRDWKLAGLFCFLFCLMNAGNFIDYVPVRTFSTHGDMVTLERGLQISPWWVLVVAGTPFAWAIWRFLHILLPDARYFLFPENQVRQIALVVTSSFMMFGYYGSSGLHGYGEISRRISLFSVLVMLPAALILCWPRKTNRRQTPVAG